jgi:hypothetical protein
MTARGELCVEISEPGCPLLAATVDGRTPLSAGGRRRLESVERFVSGLLFLGDFLCGGKRGQSAAGRVRD